MRTCARSALISMTQSYDLCPEHYREYVVLGFVSEEVNEKK